MLHCIVWNEKSNLNSCKETKHYRVKQSIKSDWPYSKIMFYIWLYMLLLYLVNEKKKREINQSRKRKRAMGNRWMMTFKEWHEKLKKCYTKPGNCHFAAMASICDRLQHCFTTSISEGCTDVTMRNSQFESSSTASNSDWLQRALNQALPIPWLILIQDLKLLLFLLIPRLSTSVVTSIHRAQ